MTKKVMAGAINNPITAKTTIPDRRPSGFPHTDGNPQDPVVHRGAIAQQPPAPQSANEDAATNTNE